jgi:ribulose-5-phosphate 4-epimerase/fuculose-1-phosphate aldolase
MNQTLNTVQQTVSQAEWQLRVDLAACYRLIAMHGWDDLVFTHVSARIPGPEHHFLINPYGFMFEEITASSLVKVDNTCQPVIPTPYKVNPAGFIIHSAIHYARDDATCVLHTHTTAGIAVSAQRAGLLPISQQSTIVLGSLGYHDYEGIAVADDEKPRLVKDLGTNNYLMLRNHGLLTVGGTVAQAFLNMFVFERACQIQVLAQGQGADLVAVDSKVLAGVKSNLKIVTAGMGDSLVWPALLRKLNRINPGFDQ